MTESELKQLIRDVILEILGSEQPKAPPKRALVMFTGASIGFTDSIEELRKIKALGYELDYLQTESAKHINDQALIASVGMRDISKVWSGDHCMLIIPTMTVNTVAKVAMGIGDTLSTNIIAEFIMRNKLVVAATNAACPDSKEKREWFPELPEGYAARLRDNLGQLKRFGVRLCPVQKLAETVAATTAVAAVDVKLRVVSEQTLKDIPDGGTIQIGKQTLVTALARDEAGRRSITIQRTR